MNSHRLPGGRGVFRAALRLVLFTLGLPALLAQTTRYEAEAASLAGCSVASSITGYSGSGYVDAGSFTGAATITFTVNAPAAGAYTLRFRYHGGSGQKFQDVQVNSGAYAYTEFPASSTWADKDLANIALAAGANTVRLRANWGWNSFDYLEVIGAGGGTGGTGGTGGAGTTAYNRVRKNVGTNFWFVYDGEVPEGFTGGLVFDPSANFATTANPWNPAFLAEIRPYQVLRFMDWYGGNGDGQTDWNTQRTRKADPVQQGDVMGPVVNGYFTDIQPVNQGDGRLTTGVAVEWLIDLCNRNQSDLWINIPYRTINPADFPNGDDFNNEYVHKLAILLRHGVDMRGVSLKKWVGGKAKLTQLATRTKQDFIKAGGIDTGYALDPALKIYVEYSNELWCCSRPQVKWVEDQGAALGFATRRHFGAWAEVRVWKAFQDVFGATAMGGARVWRVAGPTHKEGLNAYSFQGYFDNVYRNAAANRNPWYANGGAGSVKPDAWKWAAYVGGDGSESDWSMRVASERSDALALRAVMANSFGITKLFAYEGGQHLDSRAGPFAHDASAFDRYTRWLNQVDDGYDLVLHYGHYGKWQAADDPAGYGSWGAKSYVGQPDAEAHKYRAIKAYIDGN